jgi:serine phosphatase RsbU (regulator of sigma subunit)/pSer/pThr/pTyr-binding forkhead associated (FHA) protein
MAGLVVMRGPLSGRHFTLAEDVTVLGRDHDVGVPLESLAVSRHHARVQFRGGAYTIEDLGSSNGTFVNGRPLEGTTPLAEGDLIQVGPYVFEFRMTPPPVAPDTDLVIREEVGADPSEQTLYSRDPARLLEAVLTVGRQLAGSLETPALLDRLLEQLFVFFPQADRGLVLLCEGDNLVMRAKRCRESGTAEGYPYSRTIVRRALEEGIGVLSEDVRADLRFSGVATVAAADLRSVVCVPLIGSADKRLGILQLDCLSPGRAFRLEDLQLLTVLGMHVSASLENAALHAELVREERLCHELALARQIQQGFLPGVLPALAERPFELHAWVRPAREVSGDLYDYTLRDDGRLAFLVADVSGKGIPAALLMLAVRTLVRHPAMGRASPSEALQQLNSALAADNRSGVFVTAICGNYNSLTGEVVLACCGHPAPLLRRASGAVEILPVQGGVPLGMLEKPVEPAEHTLILSPDDCLILFTDGVTETTAPGSDTQFGLERLREAVAGQPGPERASACAARLASTVERFARAAEPADDQTLLILQRRRPATSN